MTAKPTIDYKKFRIKLRSKTKLFKILWNNSIKKKIKIENPNDLVNHSDLTTKMRIHKKIY